MIIRRALAQDANELAEFNSSIARETEGIELIPEVIGAGVKAMIENPQMGFYLVVELDNGIQASLMVTTEWSDWRNGMFWWIQSVYIKPEVRQQGVYRRLYAHTKALAKQQPGVCGLRLYAIAEEPIWFFSNGSSISFLWESIRRSVANLCALPAIPDSASSNWASIFRE